MVTYQGLVFTRLSLEYHLVSPFYSYILVTLGLCQTHINTFRYLTKALGLLLSTQEARLWAAHTLNCLWLWHWKGQASQSR